MTTVATTYRCGLLLSVACLFFVLPQGASGQSSSQSGDSESEGAAPALIPSARAAVRSGAIAIDGWLDDAGWAGADLISGFIQGDPVEGIPAEADTEVRILIDGEAIYIAARMIDDDPGHIGDRMVRRDEKGSFDPETTAGGRVASTALGAAAAQVYWRWAPVVGKR